jgi:(4S)-4-hydroxy-5-phosphonooxypentane-2,3-dione isomerase
MICLAVQLLVKSGKESEVARLFGPAAEASRREPGCLLYIAHQKSDDPRRFLIYEQYKDEAALEAHRNSPHFKQYIADGVYTMIEEREAGLYSPLP